MAQDPRVCGGESLVPRESAGGAQKKGEAVAGGEGRWSSGGRAATRAGRGPWWFIRLDRPAVGRLPLPARSWASGPPREGHEDAWGSPVAWRQPALLRAARRDAAARAGVPRPCPARVVASTVRGPVAGEAPSLTAPLGSHRPGRGRGSDTPVQEQVPGRSLSASRPRVRRSVACHPRPSGAGRQGACCSLFPGKRVCGRAGRARVRESPARTAGGFQRWAEWRPWGRGRRRRRRRPRVRPS